MSVLKGVVILVNVKFCFVVFSICLVLFKFVCVVFNWGCCNISVDVGLFFKLECCYLFNVWIFCKCFFFKVIMVFL